MRTNLLAIASVAAVSGCSDPNVELPGGSLGRYDGEGPTWGDVVYPILQDNCVTCHRMGQISTYKPLDNYDAAVALAEEIALRVQGLTADKLTMPPFPPGETETCIPAYDYANDLRLTDQEIADLVAWADEGAPHGDNADVPEPLQPAAVTPLAGAIEYTFEEGTPISIVDDDMYDVHTCIIYDPGISTRTRRISGLQVNPGVDHLYKGAQVMLDRYRESAQYVADDSPRDHGVSWYDCAEGLGFEGELLTSFLAGTAPPAEGSVAPGGVVVPPFEFPPSAALAIPGDAVFVVRMLYHPHWANLDPNDPTEVTEELSWVDTTTLSVRWETHKALLTGAQLFNFGSDAVMNADGTGLQTEPFEVPAGDPAIGAVPHTEIMTGTIPGTPTDSYAVWGVVPSMGRWGSTIEITVTPSDGGPDQCLGAVPEWHVSFQAPIRYSDVADGRPIVHGGDLVTATCTYMSQSLNVLTLDPGVEQERCEATLGMIKLTPVVAQGAGGL